MSAAPPLYKAHADAQGGRRVIVAARQFAGRPYVELRAKISRRGRAEVEEFAELTPKQARELHRVLGLAIASLEATDQDRCDAISCSAPGAGETLPHDEQKLSAAADRVGERREVADDRGVGA
jgi:RNA 3'-terminal phosphate cyclase